MKIERLPVKECWEDKKQSLLGWLFNIKPKRIFVCYEYTTVYTLERGIDRISERTICDENGRTVALECDQVSHESKYSLTPDLDWKPTRT